MSTQVYIEEQIVSILPLCFPASQVLIEWGFLKHLFLLYHRSTSQTFLWSVDLRLKHHNTILLYHKSTSQTFLWSVDLRLKHHNTIFSTVQYARNPRHWTGLKFKFSLQICVEYLPPESADWGTLLARTSIPVMHVKVERACKVEWM